MKKKIIFIVLFAFFGFLAMQIPFTQLIGSKAKFTLFDFFGPIAGGFLGSFFGVITVALMELANWALHGWQTDAGTIIRFFPMLFATWYFTRHSKIVLIAPCLAIIAFLAHPVGRQVWYFTLFWVIPLIAYFWRERFLFVRALGTTFTAHAVGGALWIWNFEMPAAVWQGLIPVVFKERFLFAVGITVIYLAFSWLFNYLAIKKKVPLSFLTLEKPSLFSPKTTTPQ